MFTNACIHLILFVLPFTTLNCRPMIGFLYYQSQEILKPGSQRIKIENVTLLFTQMSALIQWNLNTWLLQTCQWWEGCNFPVPSALRHSSVVTLSFNFFLPLQGFYLMLKLMLNSNDHKAVISALWSENIILDDTNILLSILPQWSMLLKFTILKSINQSPLQDNKYEGSSKSFRTYFF